MEIHEDALVPVELKYCERCGGLWLRPPDDEEVYCPACLPKMAEFPPPMRKPPPRIDRDLGRGRQRMTAARIAIYATQIDRMEVTDEWLWDDGANPDLWMYRGRTLALLKRYRGLSIELGRPPSVLGREFFRTRITSYPVSTGEIDCGMRKAKGKARSRQGKTTGSGQQVELEGLRQRIASYLGGSSCDGKDGRGRGCEGGRPLFVEVPVRVDRTVPGGRGRRMSAGTAMRATPSPRSFWRSMGFRKTRARTRRRTARRRRP
jgi:Zn-finger nucleic acid-binding protein